MAGDEDAEKSDEDYESANYLTRMDIFRLFVAISG